MNNNQKHFVILSALFLSMFWGVPAVKAQLLTNSQPLVVTNFVVVVTNVIVTNSVAVNNVTVTNSVVAVTNAVLSNSLALNPVVRILPEWELETWKIILDKLILGAIFFGLGWWATNRMEAHKSRIAFTTELNKTRIEKLASVWGALYAYKDTAIEILECARNADLTKDYPEEMGELLKKAEDANEDGEKAIRQNSFWLGQQQTKNVENYREKIADCWRGLSERKPPQYFEREIQALEQGIDEIHAQLLRGDLQSNSPPRRGWFSWLRRS